MSYYIPLLLFPFVMLAAGCASQEPTGPRPINTTDPVDTTNATDPADTIKPPLPLSRSITSIASFDLQLSVGTVPGAVDHSDTIPRGGKSYPVSLACNGHCIWKGDTVTLRYGGTSHEIGFEIEELSIVFDPSRDLIRSLRYTSTCDRKLGQLTSEYGNETITAVIEMVDVPLVRRPNGSYTFEVAGDRLRNHVRTAVWKEQGFQNSLGGPTRHWGRTEAISNRQPATANVKLVIK